MSKRKDAGTRENIAAIQQVHDAKRAGRKEAYLSMFDEVAKNLTSDEIVEFATHYINEVSEGVQDAVLEQFEIEDIEDYAIKHGECIKPTEEILLDNDQQEVIRQFILASNPPINHPIWAVYEIVIR